MRKGFTEGPTPPILATVAAVLMSATVAMAGNTDAPDPIGVVLDDGAPFIKVTIVKDRPTTGRQVEILDATADSDVSQAINALLNEQFDGVVIAKPASACDDTVDCSREVADTCRLLGGKANSTSFSALSKTCSGTCSTGHSVSVVCVTPRPS